MLLIFSIIMHIIIIIIIIMHIIIIIIISTAHTNTLFASLFCSILGESCLLPALSDLE